MIELDERLCTALPFLRPADRIADIGTDHAFLPIYAVRNGLCSEALATDINEGPVQRAMEHIRRCGLEEKITVMKTDGLVGVESFGPDTILIFGMGGELIAGILSKTQWIRKKGTRLILQPMTHDEILRAFLYENGFKIFHETISRAQGRLYVTIAAEYDGTVRSFTRKDCWLGELAGPLGDGPVDLWFEKKKDKVQKIIREMARHGVSPDEKCTEELAAFSEALKLVKVK